MLYVDRHNTIIMKTKNNANANEFIDVLQKYEYDTYKWNEEIINKKKQTWNKRREKKRCILFMSFYIAL